MWYKIIKIKLHHVYKHIRPSFKYVGAAVCSGCLLYPHLENAKNPANEFCKKSFINEIIKQVLPNRVSDIATEKNQVDLNYEARRNKINKAFLKEYKNIIVDVNKIVKDDVVLPASVDWREKGFLTPVRKQNRCGSCYAMTTVGGLEAAIFVQTGRLVRLSPQSLLDCDDGNNGCGGGRYRRSLYHVMQSKKIPTEESYPYVAKKESCKYKDINKNINFLKLEISKIIKIPQGDEKALKKSVAKFGPTVVSVYFSETFYSRSVGIYNNPEDSKRHKVNHSVLVVGYGTEDGTDYWILKDSHGRSFGEDGYIRIARNVNMCSIDKEDSFLPVLSRGSIK